MQGSFNELVKSNLEYTRMLTAEPELNAEEQQLEREKAKEAVQLVARVRHRNRRQRLCKTLSSFPRKQSCDCGLLMTFSKKRCRRIV